MNWLILISYGYSFRLGYQYLVIRKLYCGSKGRNPATASYKLNSLDYLYRPRQYSLRLSTWLTDFIKHDCLTHLLLLGSRYQNPL